MGIYQRSRIFFFLDRLSRKWCDFLRDQTIFLHWSLLESSHSRRGALIIIDLDHDLEDLLNTWRLDGYLKNDFVDIIFFTGKQLEMDHWSWCFVLCFLCGSFIRETRTAYIYEEHRGSQRHLLVEEDKAIGNLTEGEYCIFRIINRSGV